MFMFRSRRSQLVRKLWKLQCRNEEGSEDQSDVLKERKSVAGAMLKRLKETALEGLVRAVEARGADSGSCCLVPKGDLRLGRHSVAPHVLCCQLFRWTDLRHEFELVKLPLCGLGEEDGNIYECCNPFHWSRIAKPATPPPPYSVLAPQPSDSLNNPDDSTTSFPVSEATGGSCQNCSSSDQSGRVTWCSLAYWEERTRVGRLFSVSSPQAAVFSTLPRPHNRGDAMCLQTLARANNKPSQSTLKTREKIGLGLILSRDDTGVLIHNRTEVPLFVNSPTLDIPNSRTFSVFKIPPGYSMQVFDYEKSRLYQTIRDPQTLDGPFDPHAVRVSFAKGWGTKYSRQFVTSCPCWLEILLVPPR